MNGALTQQGAASNPSRLVRGAALVVPVLVAFFVSGCTQGLRTVRQIADQRPEVALTQSPVSSTDPYYYAYELRWSGYDPDGQIAYYEYAVDPPTAAGSETTWVQTQDNRHTFFFRSARIDSGTATNGQDFHVVVLKAVDNDGMPSAPVSRAFFSTTVAPQVAVVQPVPNHLLYPLLPPTTTITWQGLDPDGFHSQQPVKYKWKLLSDASQDFSIYEALLRPDSLRRAYAPGFSSWDSVSGDTTSVRLYSLVPDRKYLFVVVAFDEAGAYSPVFNLDTNMLYFVCSYAGQNGPRITLYNDFFEYTYMTPGFVNDPSQYVQLEVPAGEPITFRWKAAANAGTFVTGYRWTMDIDRLDDETPRSNQLTDWSHWSNWDVTGTAGTVGPFAGTAPGGEQHLFYVEARDENGLQSLGIIQFHVVRATLDQGLLFVDDTRFAVDQLASGSPDSVRIPSGAWPDAAELDTFLFARGGVRWRDYPNGTLSSPGIFSGYRFDTLGTRGLTSGVPLATLARYRQVVWMTDPAVDKTGLPGTPFVPMPILRWMSQPNASNALPLYASLGGRVWLLGGGIALNSLLAWNQPANDVGGTVFSSATGELAPGRMMFELPHWRSEITCATATKAALNPGAGGWPGAPDYTQLPTLLQWRNLDPVPPLRGPGSFYASLYSAEYLSQPNAVLEIPGPGLPAASVLDTVLFTVGPPFPDHKPVMTWYHGAENAGVVFSGLPLWYFRRADAQTLGDFVLQRIWSLSRGSPSAPQLVLRGAPRERARRLQRP